VYAVIQREWADDAPGLVKIGRYDTSSQTWSFVRYALDAVSLPTGGWVGLSEITLLPSGKFAIIERDNQLGDDAQVKRVYAVDLAGAEFRPFGDARGLVTVSKSLLADLRDALREGGILTPDKLEGFAVAKGGRAYAVTDNDGLDAALGDTVWLELGKLER
jgi:Esterase-like activity of phytase